VRRRRRRTPTHHPETAAGAEEEKKKMSPLPQLFCAQVTTRGSLDDFALLFSFY